MSSSLRILGMCLLIGPLSGAMSAQAPCEVVTSVAVPLYWDANSEPNIDHYNVYRSSTSSSSFFVIGFSPQGPDPVSFADTTPLLRAYYAVTAVNTDGRESGFSDTLCVDFVAGSSNNAPIAVDDDASTPEDRAVVIDVLGNDNDGDGDSLTVASVTQPDHGSVVINANGTLGYTPNQDFNGSDTFHYTVADGTGWTDTGTVTVSVTAVQDPPTAVDDSSSTPEEVAVIIEVLSNDSDPDGDSLTVASVTQPAHGSVVIIVNRRIEYTPDPNFTGSDSFDYSVDDGHGGTDSAIVRVSVLEVNDVPIAVDDTEDTQEDVAVIIDVLSNDSDADGDNLKVTLLTQPLNGSAVTDVHATVVFYTPARDFYGSDNFRYTVSDGRGGTDTATVMVDISAVNDDPAAGDDQATTKKDVAVSVDVLSNDSDVDGDSLAVDSVTQPLNGSVVLGADETVTYTPAGSFNGHDSFSYTAADGNGGMATARVTVGVSVPIATDDDVSTQEDVAIVFDVLSNDEDPDGDPLAVHSVTQAQNGQVVDLGNNRLSYNPHSNFNGGDSFHYTVTDGEGGTATAQVNVSVLSVFDDPTAADDEVLTQPDLAVTIDVLGNDEDVDGEELQVVSLVQPANGAVVVDADERVRYTPAENFEGIDSFSYTAADTTGRADTATVTVTVAEHTVLMANFMNGNSEALASRVYLWNPSEKSAEVLAQVFTLPLAGGVARELTNAPVSVGTVEGQSALNLKLYEDILVPLGASIPYLDDGGNLTLRFTVMAPDVQGSGQVFSSHLAFGTYELQEVPFVLGVKPTVLVAPFMNGNSEVFNSRVYLWNPSTGAGKVTVRVFTLPHTGASALLGTVDLGTLGASSARNIKLAEDILDPLGTVLPYTNDGGNMMLEFTIEAPDVQGAGQVFSSNLAFGTYALQKVGSASQGSPTVLVAHSVNGNSAVFNSRVYLWNPSTSAGAVRVRVFSLPATGNSLLLGEVGLGILGASSARNIKLAEDILDPLGIPLPYSENGGELTLEFTVEAPDVLGAAQVFSPTLAYGTYPLQRVLGTSRSDPSVLTAHFTNGNNGFVNSRIYLWNPSTSVGEVTVRVFTLSLVGGTAQELTDTPFSLGTLGPESARSIRLAEDILAPLGVPLPYMTDGGNLTVEITVEAPDVQGAAQVFSPSLAFGTYPLQ